MNCTKKYSWFFKLPIMAVYLLFFTVQIFYNLDTNRQLFNPDKAVGSVFVQDGFHAKTVVKTVNAHSRFPSKLRLNKRYEPSHLPVPVVTITEIPVLQIEPLTIGADITQFYTSVFLSSYGLRGPPAIG
jgi:hypothetical protein